MIVPYQIHSAWLHWIGSGAWKHPIHVTTFCVNRVPVLVAYNPGTSLPIHVEAYSGYKVNERPIRFHLDETTYEIEAIDRPMLSAPNGISPPQKLKFLLKSLYAT
jgi:hypothetical protein